MPGNLHTYQTYQANMTPIYYDSVPGGTTKATSPGVTSRGCPFNCIFCIGHKMVGKRARFRNPKLVVDEIEEILDNGFKAINIVDDLFTMNRRHVMETLT